MQNSAQSSVLILRSLGSSFTGRNIYFLNFIFCNAFSPESISNRLLHLFFPLLIELIVLVHFQRSIGILRVFVKFFKIQRPVSGGELPLVGEFVPYPIARRVNSSHAVDMEDDPEDRRKTFPSMRSKPYTPLV